MKATVLCLLLYGMINAVNAQQPSANVIPEAAVAALKKAYPNATDIKWEQKKASAKAEFKIGKIDHDVWFTDDGTVVKHRYEITKSELPAAITEAIKKDFPAYEIKDCKRTDEKASSRFNVELKSTADKKHVDYSSDGKIIPKEEKN